MTTPSLELQIDSDPAAVPELQARLLTALEQIGLDKMSAFQLTGAVIEAVNNCIEHAYAGRPGESLELSLSRTPDSVEVTIRDHGLPLPGGIPDIDTAPDPEALSGRGWPIIHSWTDALRYQRVGNDNLLILSKHLETHAP